MAKAQKIHIKGDGPSARLEFCLRLSRAHATLTRRLDNSLSSLHGLSFVDFAILYNLDRAPGSKLRRIDLAERLGMTASGVTRTLLPLEKLGLVSRQPDPRDARVGFATLTDAGRRLFKYAMDSIEPLAREASQSMTAEQIDALMSPLAQLAGLNLSNT